MIHKKVNKVFYKKLLNKSSTVFLFLAIELNLKGYYCESSIKIKLQFVCIFKNVLLEWFYNPSQSFSCCLSIGCFDYFFLELYRFCTLFVPKKLVFNSGFICFKLIPYNKLEFLSKSEMHTKLVFRDVSVAVFGRLSFPSILFYCRPSFS